MTDRREAILAAARRAMQAHGYDGLNFRDLAAVVGVTAATLHHHFATKADLGLAIVRRRRQDTETRLNEVSLCHADPALRLGAYVELFRAELCDANRMGLHGMMAAQHDDVPDAVRHEVNLVADVHVGWLVGLLLVACPTLDQDVATRRARSIFAAVSGGQLYARGRADVAFFDELMRGFEELGLFWV